MGKEVHHIKTHALSADWRALYKQWNMLSVSSSEIREKFFRTYLQPALGQELSINETKGKKCVRMYYNEYDEILSIRIYDSSGYEDLLLNFDYGLKGDNYKEEAETEFYEWQETREEPIDEDVYTTTYVHDFLDVQREIDRTSDKAPEVVIQMGDHTLHFKKIRACRWDVYMTDPFWLYYCIMGEEGRFYELGYKLTEATHKDVDGIIVGSRHMYYDHQGLLLKKVYLCGTPWGSLLPYDEEVWEYDFHKNIVTMKEISVRRDAIRRMHRYSMDDQRRIRERKSYSRPRKGGEFDWENRQEDGFVHHSTLQYTYNTIGKLREIKKVLHYPLTLRERTVFEYDVEGRLIAQRDYNDQGELTGDQIYRYLSDTRVEYTDHIYTHSNKDKGKSEEQV